MARRLVEQRAARDAVAAEQQRVRAAMLAAAGDGTGEMREVGGGGWEGGRGSFRLTRGDKRRSWFGFEVPVVAVPVGVGGGGGGGAGREMEGRVRRGGRCC